MKKIVKSFRLVAILVLFLGLFSQSCFAYEPTYADYNVTSEATLDSALTDTSTTDKTLNINSDIKLENNLSTPAGTTISIEGNGKTLDGNSKTGFSVASGQTLNINNYGAENSGIITNSIQNFSKTSSDSYSIGGVIYSEGTINISDTLFTNNNVIRTSDDSYVAAGGVIGNYSGTANISNSIFTYNYASSVNASDGGAIFNLDKMNISSSTFTGNYAITTTSSYSFGGAIYNYNIMSISDSTFEGNGIENYNTTTHTGTTVTEKGGAIYNADNTLNISETTFKYNAVTQDGGAIYNDAETSNIYGATKFNYNEATNGGAIYNDSGNLNIYSGAEFISNTAMLGGAIYNIGGKANIYGTTFTSNSSNDGGAIANTNGAMTNIYNSTFTSNSATVVTGSDISGAGGAIANYNLSSSASDAVLNIYNSEFANNYAGLGGGAIGNAYSIGTDATVSIYNSTFTGNYTTEASSSRLSGGAIANMNAISYIEGSTFEGNGIQDYNTDTHTGTTKTRYGGAIANYWDKDGAISTAAKITINDSTFKYNAVTQDGGAIYNETEAGTDADNKGSATVIINKSEFTSNKAGDEGGAIANYTGADYSTATVTINGSTFTSNTASSNGGAIFNGQSSTATDATAKLTINNCTFTSNTATNGEGGAIYNDYGTVTISYSTFKSNTSNGNGGAIKNSYGTMTITDSAFGGDTTSDGNSGNYGGAINNYGTGVLTVTNSTFKNNSTTTGSGGAICNGEGSAATIINSTFTDNTATTYGGAIYNYYTGVLNIVGDNGVTSFSGNSATSDGNDIWMDSSSGTLNLYAGDSGYIIFNDGISGGSGYTLNINPASATYTTDGMVIFNSTVSNADITLSNGILTLGTYGANKTYFSNVNLTLEGGVLNTVNGVIDNSSVSGNSSISLNSFTSSDSGLFFDATVGGTSTSSDKFSVSGTTSGTLAICGINILSDVATSATSFDLGLSGLTLSSDGLTAYSAGTSDAYQYTMDSTSTTDGTVGFTQASTTYSSALATAVTNSCAYKSFSLTGNYTNGSDLGDMGGAMFTIFGNEYNIIGSSKSGITVTDTQTLNILNVGDIDATSYANTGITGFSRFINNNGGTVNIYDSVFSSNTSGFSNGGAISNASGTLNVTDSVFYANAANLGGAIYNEGTANITGTKFINNYATRASGDADGGAIYNTGTLNVADSTFTGNYVTNTGSGSSYGGAICISGGSTTIYSSTFEGNGIQNYDTSTHTGTTRTANGGAIVNIGNNLTIDNSTFSYNAATNNGGAIHNFATYSTITSLVNSTFTSNSAGNYGGAIYNLGTISSIYNSTFTSNSAAGNYGGAIYNTGTISSIAYSTFTGNDAVNAGGAIYNTGTISSIYGTEFINNSVSLSSSINGAEGGAIYNTGTLNVAYSTFTGNYTTNSDSGSSYGGAISTSGSSTTIYGSTFEGNGIQNYGSTDTSNPATVITRNGGAIFSNCTNLTIDNSTFSYNSAVMNGGAIYNNTSGVLTLLDNSTFSYNAAKNDGGVIYNTGTISSIYNSTFTNNTATGYGGAIYNQGTISSIDNSTFTSNSALNGGAIYNLSDELLTISNSTFTGNYSNTSTSSYGGAIYNDESEMFLSNSTFKGNGIQNYGSTTLTPTTVTEYGGAISNTGTLTIVNSTFTGNKATTAGGAIYNNNGTLNIIADAGNTTFSGNYANGSLNDIYLDTSSTLNLNAGNGGKITLGGGIVSNSSSNTININAAGTYGSDSTTSPTDGEVVLNGAITGGTDIASGDSIAAVYLNGGTLTLGADSYLDNTALTLEGGTLNLQNSVAGTMALNTLTVLGNTNLKIDVDLATSTSDKITGTTSDKNSELTISSIKLLSDSTSSTTTTQLLGSGLAGNNFVTLGVTKAYTPIYAYNVSYDDTTGQLRFSGGGGGGSFNPAILSGPASANVGAYMTQVNIYNEVLNRSELFMSLPLSERIMMKNQNKYADAGVIDVAQQVFSPTYLPDEKAGLWFKQYTTFENVPLSNGPNVSNVGYGAIVGGDTPLVDLGHGCDGYLTVYAAYNGSHQNYDQVGINQNGGSLGVTGTLYKGNFFTALTASVGDSYGQANTMYGVDNFNTLLAGIASKSGYNFEFKEGKYILQPSIFLSYTFANTFDYTTASGVNVTSDPLNAIQIAPGVKFIYNAKKGWQPYLAANMVFNIMDGQKFRANDVALPQMSIDPYFEYGLGIQRRWGERFTGFGQAMLRGGGRNGIALMFGFRIALGK